MKIAIATDHRGVEYKREIMETLSSKYDFVDCSAQNYDADDYSDYAIMVGEKVANKEADLGVLLCGTGIGMSIAANKVKGVRCALVHNEEEAALSRIHNNANVVAIGTSNDMKDILVWIEKFINTSFSNEERHVRRVNKIIHYENGEYNGL